MFLCRLGVLVTEGATTVELRRDLHLPFPPSPGLEIGGIAEGPVVVSFVLWDEAEGRFEVDLAEESACEGCSLNDIVESYGSEWEVVRDE